MSSNGHGRRAKRWAAAGLTFGLAAGGYGIASAASGQSGSSSTSAPCGSPSSGANSPGGPAAGGGKMHVPGGHEGPWGEGPWGHGHGRAGGTITALTDTSITLSGPDSQTHQVLTDASTTYHRDGGAATRADLAVGERVAIRPTRPPGAGDQPASGNSSSAPSAITAADVDILSPSMRGTVSSVTPGGSGSTIVITDIEGFARTIHTSSATVYRVGDHAGAAGDVKPGERIAALGTIDADKTDLDATKVTVVLPHVSGVVRSISGNTITLNGPGGASRTITVNGATTYSSAGKSASLSDVKNGDVLTATGQLQPDGSLVASSVTFAPAPAPGAGGWGHEARRDGWPEGPGGPGDAGPASQMPTG